MRKQLIIKIAIAALVVAIAVASIIIYKKTQNPVADVGGGVTVELVSLDGETQSKQLDFEEGDTLVDILLDNYEVNYEETEYGFLLLGIDGIQTDFTSTYIAVYINGEYSNYGLSSILLEEGSLYSFRETKV
ncbi:MAG: DUF4430 domain-containing protein [Clostridia bacterium]|nr:DUF4430 domain-containing protein [Clostridia bacterium]